MIIYLYMYVDSLNQVICNDSDVKTREHLHIPHVCNFRPGFDNLVITLGWMDAHKN